jgi:hypothetical protein
MFVCQPAVGLSLVVISNLQILNRNVVCRLIFYIFLYLLSAAKAVFEQTIVVSCHSLYCS